MSSARTSVAVDLFGDLDLTLVAFLAETLAEIAHAGPADIVLSTRGLSLTSNGALRALDHALADARKAGTGVEVIPGSRKMRHALVDARIAPSPGSKARRPVVRHVMLARHAEQGELDRSA